MFGRVVLVAHEAGGQLDHRRVDGGAMLLDENDLVVGGYGQDADHARAAAADGELPAAAVDQPQEPAFAEGSIRCGSRH